MLSLHGPFYHALLSHTHGENTWIDIGWQHIDLDMPMPYLSASLSLLLIEGQPTC